MPGGPIDVEIQSRMRADWNDRAREDAHYYVAFGAREQDESAFYATAEEVVKGLRWELKRAPANNPRALRFLEIGCGPGRLMYFLSRQCGEIHGVDVSDEMIRIARQRLASIPHAHPHAGSGSDLALFADESFDFVYSYAVFQHIPSRDVVFHYLREAHRVLKTGALLRVQVNGLPQTAKSYDTWSGVRISAAEIRAFCRETGFQLLALEGLETQYMWTTWVKREPGWQPRPGGRARIRRVTNAFSSEPVAPPRGRFASISLWVETLPADADLNSLEVRVAGHPGTLTYLGRPESDGLQQLNALLPRELETGVAPVELSFCGEPLSEPARLRVIPPPPPVPRIVQISDGIHLTEVNRTLTGTVKLIVEEFDPPESFAATIGGVPVEEVDVFRCDPAPPRDEINFRVPAALAPGVYPLEMRLGARRFAPVALRIEPIQ
jgi:SAM-dependent methyltransferase